MKAETFNTFKTSVSERIKGLNAELANLQNKIANMHVVKVE